MSKCAVLCIFNLPKWDQQKEKLKKSHFAYYAWKYSAYKIVFIIEMFRLLQVE